MQFKEGRAVFLTGVCVLAGCGVPSVTIPDEFSPSTPASDCLYQWWLLVNPTTIKVGETAVAEVTMFALSTRQIDWCEAHVTSIKVTASVPGIVTVKSGDSSLKSLLTGAKPGQTELTAEIVFTDSSTVMSSGQPPTTILVQAN